MEEDDHERTTRRERNLEKAIEYFIGKNGRLRFNFTLEGVVSDQNNTAVTIIIGCTANNETSEFKRFMQEFNKDGDVQEYFKTKETKMLDSDPLLEISGWIDPFKLNIFVNSMGYMKKSRRGNSGGCGRVKKNQSWTVGYKIPLIVGILIIVLLLMKN